MCIWFIFVSFTILFLKNRVEREREQTERNRDEEWKKHVFSVWIRAPVERFELHFCCLYSNIYVRRIWTQSAHTTRCAKCETKMRRDTVSRDDGFLWNGDQLQLFIFSVCWLMRRARKKLKIGQIFIGTVTSSRYVNMIRRLLSYKQSAIF